jgi:hypothetical protein
VLLFRCRKQSENQVHDVQIQAGVSFLRFIERLTNEFGRQVHAQPWDTFSACTLLCYAFFPCVRKPCARVYSTP